MFGAVLERVLFRRFRQREHLDQVLLTFALILLFEEARAALLGNEFHAVPVPAAAGFLGAGDRRFRLFRLSAGGPGDLPAGRRRRWSRSSSAPASAPRSAPPPKIPKWSIFSGVDARLIHTLVFAAGTALAMLAGALAAPLQSVYPGMGDGFLILSFIVVVIGGLGSIAGAFWAALLVGLIDTLGKVYAAAGRRHRGVRADGAGVAVAPDRAVSRRGMIVA